LAFGPLEPSVHRLVEPLSLAFCLHRSQARAGGAGKSGPHYLGGCSHCKTLHSVRALLRFCGARKECMMEFEDEISDLQRLRELMPFDTSSGSALKVTDSLNDVARRFIELCPFIVVATKANDGLIDVSPKGDPAGFVKVLNDKTLAIPDRLGNRRADGFVNILTDPNIAVTFFVPDHGFSLRVAGKARIVRDRTLNATMTVNGKEPALALVVHVEEAFMHCAKALIRSGLWRSETWPERGSAPKLADWQVEVVDDGRTFSELVTVHTNDEKTRLY
jgi:PPOX class probable FMN-dependent enzyme